MNLKCTYFNLLSEGIVAACAEQKLSLTQTKLGAVALQFHDREGLPAPSPTTPRPNFF